MRAVLTVVVLVAALAAGAWWMLARDAGPGSAPRVAAGPSPVVATPVAAPRVDLGGLALEAKRHVARLTAPDPIPVAVERADHFVTGDQVLTLIPDSAVETTSPRLLQSDPALSPDSPITVVREVEQIETATPERLIAQSGGDLERRVRVLEEDTEKVLTVREVLARLAQEPEATVAVIKKVRYYEITTPSELAADAHLDADDEIRIVRERYGLETVALAELMREQEGVGPESVFYVRTVRPTDSQGIWGIIQDGLLGNFARGMAIRRGEEINTYQVEIPGDADELRSDRSSSFLGRMIFDKARQTHVYNFKQHRMGGDPDRITPGQEIVIVTFEPQELVGIYRHFVESRKNGEPG